MQYPDMIVGRDLNGARGIYYIALMLLSSADPTTLADLLTYNRRPEEFRRQSRQPSLPIASM